jgi:hypothetical protein
LQVNSSPQSGGISFGPDNKRWQWHGAVQGQHHVMQHRLGAWLPFYSKLAFADQTGFRFDFLAASLYARQNA